jgi:ribosomal protein S18 acetylase RimI-like enzyme
MSHRHEQMSPPVEITLLPPTAGDEQALVARLTTLVNQVYAVAEQGLWVDGTTRTSAEEMTGLIRSGQIAVARRSGDLVGSVRVRRVPTTEGDLGEFGMLVTAPAHRGSGIGRDLIGFNDSSRWRRRVSYSSWELVTTPSVST